MDINVWVFVLAVIWAALTLFWLIVLIVNKTSKGHVSKQVVFSAKKMIKYNLIYLVIVLVLGALL